MDVLIADDNVTTLRLLERYLHAWGYAVTSVGSGTEAWEILRRPESPRLVVLDWMMPGFDGIELCRRMRALAWGDLFHIIILTARESRQDILTAFEAGADDFITKRFDKDELRSRINVGQRVVALQSTLHARVEELERAMSHIKRLQGILPMCMHCHKIRTDREVWQKLDEYITENTDAMLSHSLCPECLERYYPQVVSRAGKKGTSRDGGKT